MKNSPAEMNTHEITASAMTFNESASMPVSTDSASRVTGGATRPAVSLPAAN